MFAYFKKYHEIFMKNFKSLYGLGGRCLKTDVCVDFKPYFKDHNLVSVQHKSIILGQNDKSQHDLTFWWCQFIDLLKFETRPSSLLNFGTAHWFSRRVE